ncbi:Pentatricopeptide repeat-containing protein, mitochondrial [Glycine soja]
MSNSLPHFCIVCTVLPSLKQHHHDVSQTPSEPLLRRFCSLPPPSPRDESDVELVSKLLLQHHNPFHATESSLQLHSITLSPSLPLILHPPHRHHGQDSPIRRAWKVSLHPEEMFERTIRNAEEVFDQMRESGIEPEVTSFSILLHVNSRAHMPQLVLDQLRLMKEKGICPNVVMYTSVIKCLASCGWLEDAERLLEEMVRDGVSPCAATATYNCFFKKFRGRKDGESALRMFKRMKVDGLCAPSSHTYVILIRMFLRFEMIKVVKEIWEDMKETGAGLDLDLYTVLIHGLCERQKWREACHYFVEMIENGFLLLKGTFDTLYRGLIQADMLRTWRRLMKMLDEELITFGSEFQNYQLKPYRR